MKFFKHFTDANRGQSLQILRQKHGMAAIGRWWTLVEICAEKMEKSKEDEYTEAHCHFSFARPYLASSLGYANLKQASSYLEALAELGLCSVQDDADVVVISMPKLLESLDRDTKRARKLRVVSAPKRKRKNKEKEEDKDIPKSKISASVENIYSNFYPRKEGKEKGVERVSKQLKTESDLQAFETAVIRYKDHCAKNRTEPKYIKHFSSFVASWRDWLDPETGTATSPASSTEAMIEEMRQMIEQEGA